MALSFNNCLIQQGSGTNFTYGTCCCYSECVVTNSSSASIEVSDLAIVFNNGLFAIQSIQINYQGSIVSAPFTVAAGTSFQLTIDYCAGNISDTDTLVVEALIDNTTPEVFSFDFEAIDLSTTANVSSLNFGTVVVGTNVSAPVTISNPTTCCYNYSLIGDCPEVTTTSDTTAKLCNGQSQTIGVIFATTIIGAFECSVTLGMDCNTLQIPITATVVDAPSGGGTSNGQKNKVDQTTPVTNCSPRTANNRCQTARAMQTAIRTNARRFGKR